MTVGEHARIVDLFAGPGGWSEGLRMLGHHDIGIEWDDAACRTRAAAGHLTVRADVAAYPPERFAGAWGLIASPPCQDFSVAGKQAGRTGDRGRLIDVVPEWVETIRPEWVACEQVPPCEGIWREHAHRYRELGYSTWVGVLNAADFGVPQTRKRAFLLASRGAASPPVPTHAKVPAAGFFGTTLRWVSMAQALGWGYDHRGSPTVTGGGGSTGGAEPFGNAARQALARWAWSRPATTLVGSFRPDVVAAPGYRTEVSRQDAEGSVSISAREALILQSFRPDYPVQGTKTKQFEQIGNAVPPLLAAHVLSSLLGVELEVAA